jgi:hypothetical protein
MKVQHRSAFRWLIAVTTCAAAASVFAQDTSKEPDITRTPQMQEKGLAVAFPWAFEQGTQTARQTALKSAEEVAQKAGYATVPTDVARSRWNRTHRSEPSYKSLPSRASIRSFGRALKADKVIYGNISWHTRSIWVNLGPKTVSTAHVNVYVLDVKTGKVDFSRADVEGRSDEESENYKIAAAVLVTPLVTAVSGGPATPQEERAVRVAFGITYHDWVFPNRQESPNSR